MRRAWWILGAVGAAWWAMRRRRRSRDELSLPERTVERGKDAAGLVAETAAELTRPPGRERP